MNATIISEHYCELGEGPTFDVSRNSLWWFNIVAKELHEHDFSTGKNKIHKLPMMASALGKIDDERQLVASEHGFCIRTLKRGKLELLTPLEDDNPTTRSNDGRVHQSGAFWLGTMGKNAEKEAGALYWYFQGEIKKLFDKITIPNSICFSPDGDIAYFCDTILEVIHRVPINPANGLPTGEPEMFVNRRGGKGGIDGSIIDKNGNLWNARWGASSVDCYNQDGEHIKSLTVPATQVSCPAFVGRKLDRIVVTTAWEGMDEATKLADPKAGLTFLLDEPVEGLAENNVVL